MKGKVFLVGAGPGDPGLITRKGQELIQSCDCLVYDALVGAELPLLAGPNCQKIYVGKRAGQHSLTQEEINHLLLEQARAGKTVCRLKGGDPFVFGRGGEEALACQAAGIPWEVVPGVTSSIAAPAYAGIPVTHREVATSFAVVTGHTATSDAPPEELPRADTLVFLMGVKALPTIVKSLLARGDAPSTPVALVRWGTTAEQQVVVGNLETIEAEVEMAALKPPALIVVGNVVNLRQKLRWFDNRPLWGQTVVVTRAREQASGLVAGLQELGARVVQCPSIRVEALEEYAELDTALQQLPSYQWVVFTSANGVEHFWNRLRHAQQDARALAHNRIVAIGPATAKALEDRGIAADYVPVSSISESVAQGLLEQGAASTRVLLVRAQEGREVLATMLTAAGARVTLAPCYRTVPDVSQVDLVRELIEAGQLHWVTFTSSSTVTNFVEAVGREFLNQYRAAFRVAVIGPITAATAIGLGLSPDATASEASVEALAQALLTASPEGPVSLMPHPHAQGGCVSTAPD